MHPRQSVEDYLSAIQEETQQLEEQLASHKQVKDVLLLHEYSSKSLWEPESVFHFEVTE